MIISLDEAHYIKERATKLAKSCYKISSFNRWVVTGTPIVNSLSDLFSLIYFLRLAPWNKISFWNAFIEVPFGKKDVRAIELVQTILEPILLR